jgi:hypothetical protein
MLQTIVTHNPKLSFTTVDISEKQVIQSFDLLCAKCTIIWVWSPWCRNWFEVQQRPCNTRHPKKRQCLNLSDAISTSDRGSPHNYIVLRKLSSKRTLPKMTTSDEHVRFVEQVAVLSVSQRCRFWTTTNAARAKAISLTHRLPRSAYGYGTVRDFLVLGRTTFVPKTNSRMEDSCSQQLISD